MYRVVLVDDSVEFLNWLKSLFENSDDFQVVGDASSGIKARHIIESLKPNLVISDVYMPDTDGLELARYVQEHLPNIRVILISVHEDRVYERLAHEEGVVAFIPKAKLSLEVIRQCLLEVE